MDKPIKHTARNTSPDSDKSFDWKNFDIDKFLNETERIKTIIRKSETHHDDRDRVRL